MDFSLSRTAVRITDRQGSGGIQGSGVLIAPDEVLTAAHVVWNPVTGPATNIVVAPDYQQDALYGTARGIAVHYFPIAIRNDLIPFSQIQTDFAVIHLDRSFD